MKRILLASVACLGLAVTLPRSANALFGAGDIVFDPTNLAEQTRHILQDLNQFKQAYSMMQQQYDGIMSTVNALSHPNRVMGMARGMLDQQMRNPGSMPSNIPGLAFGSQLSAGAARFLDQNRVYNPQGDDWQAQEMRRQAQVSANLQAEVQAGMDRSQERIEGINELEANIDPQPDVQAVAALQARVATEHLYLQNEQNNVARLQLLSQVSARVDAQRAEQKGRQDAEDWAARTRGVFSQGGN